MLLSGKCDQLFWFQRQNFVLVHELLGLHSRGKAPERLWVRIFANSLLQPGKIQDFWCYLPICVWTRNAGVSNLFSHVQLWICQEFPWSEYINKLFEWAATFLTVIWSCMFDLDWRISGRLHSVPQKMALYCAAKISLVTNGQLQLYKSCKPWKISVSSL